MNIETFHEHSMNIRWTFNYLINIQLFDEYSNILGILENLMSAQVFIEYWNIWWILKNLISIQALHKYLNILIFNEYSSIYWIF